MLFIRSLCEFIYYLFYLMGGRLTNNTEKQYLQPTITKEVEDEVEEKIILEEYELFRIQGEELNELLHRSIGALTWLNKDKRLTAGSGVLISRNIVLTAAHNVYSRKKNWQSSDFKFYLGANGTAKDYYQVEAIRYSPEFKDHNEDKLTYDFALLKLKKQVQYDQYLKLSLPCKICLQENNSNFYLQIFGFPSLYNQNYRPLNKFGLQFKLYQYGLARAGRIKMIDNQQNRIGYAISTLPGQSGCPVVVYQNIIAIHNGGGNKKEIFNIGRLIDLSLLTKLDNWCKQLKGNPFQINRENVCPHLKPIVDDYLKKKEGKQKEIKLELRNRELREIDLSKEIQVTHLDLRQNQLYAIDVSRNISLTQLYLSSNQLYDIDVSRNSSLTQLYLSSNKLYDIDVSRNISLTQLDLSDNQLSAVDVSRNISLTQLYLSSNKLYDIDVSRNISLTQLYLSSNKLYDIDVSRNSSLTQLYLSSNKLYDIDVSRNISLTQLYLSSNKLYDIDVSRNISLTQLDLSSNKLYDIDVSRNISLTQLDLSDNQLSAIDVSRNISLNELYLSSNQLSAIDVSRNISLTHLNLSSNQFSAIDVSRNISLTLLSLSSNKLSAIDVSRNFNLSGLSLQNNSLKSISLSFSRQLKTSYFSDQNSAVCKVQLLYNQGEFEECNQRITKWSWEYRIGGKENKHGCNYAFVAQKRG